MNFFKSNIFFWVKLLLLIIAAIVFLFLHRLYVPACGFDPTWVDHPRCASVQSDIFFGMFVLILLYIVFLIGATIYRTWLKKPIREKAF
ncbi:MAG: hypothetical protein ABIJ21_04765 [Nanoarchaeota archaeon]